MNWNYSPKGFYKLLDPLFQTQRTPKRNPLKPCQIYFKFILVIFSKSTFIDVYGKECQGYTSPILKSFDFGRPFAFSGLGSKNSSPSWDFLVLALSTVFLTRLFEL
jgi:hypothetical protein